MMDISFSNEANDLFFTQADEMQEKLGVTMRSTVLQYRLHNVEIWMNPSVGWCWKGYLRAYVAVGGLMMTVWADMELQKRGYGSELAALESLNEFMEVFSEGVIGCPVQIADKWVQDKLTALGGSDNNATGESFE